MHQRALTGENMLKRGFAGPFRCCFCKHVAETSTHIFVSCDFTQIAWTHLLSGLPISTPSISEPVNLFANWQLRYPRISSSSHAWKQIWQAIPKKIWWKIWLTRNDLIFNNKSMKPELVAIKAKAMLSEVAGKFIILTPIKTKWNISGLA